MDSYKFPGTGKFRLFQILFYTESSLHGTVSWCDSIVAVPRAYTKKSQKSAILEINSSTTCITLVSVYRFYSCKVSCINKADEDHNLTASVLSKEQELCKNIDSIHVTNQLT